MRPPLTRTASCLAVVSLVLAGCGGHDSSVANEPDASASDDSSARLDSTATAVDAGRDAASDGEMDASSSPTLDPTCVQTALGASPDGAWPMPTSSGIVGGMLSFKICPNGPDVGPPKICVEEASLANATLTLTASPTDISLTGTMPFRASDVQVQISLGVCSPMIDVVTNGDGACPGGTFDDLPVSIDVSINAAQGSSLSVQTVVDPTAVQAKFRSDTSLCNNAGCTDAVCCIPASCSCALGSISDWSPVKDAVITSMTDSVTSYVTLAIQAQLCANDSASACPAGTTADASGICLYPDTSCAPSPTLFSGGC